MSGLEVNAEITGHVLTSLEQNVGQNHNTEKGIVLKTREF
jgi:hypothetical protein